MVSSGMLVCGVVASLGIGVLMAQGLCVAMFALFRIHAQKVAKTRSVKAAAPVSTTLVVGG